MAIIEKNDKVKMTKKDYFNTLLELSQVQERADLKLFIEHQIELLERKNDSKKMTKTQEENLVIKKAILEFMRKDERYVIKDFMDKCSSCKDLSNQKISHLLHQLITEGHVVREEEKRKAFFKLA